MKHVVGKGLLKNPIRRDSCWMDLNARAIEQGLVDSMRKVAYAGKLATQTVPRCPNLKFLNHIWGVFESPPPTFWFFRCFSNFDKPTAHRIWSKKAFLCTFRCFGRPWGVFRYEVYDFQVILGSY